MRSQYLILAILLCSVTLKRVGSPEAQEALKTFHLD